MVDSIWVIQALALASFGVSLLHSWNREGRRAAQQWFLIGYIYVLLLVNLLVVTEQVAYSSAMLVIGAAPSLTIMLYPAVFYAVYAVAKQFADPGDLRAMAYLVFLLAAGTVVPLDALAIALGWWAFPSESLTFWNGVPFYVPFAWGIAAAAFYVMIGRIRKIKFRGNGQLFAMMIATPLLAGMAFALIALVQVVVNALAVVGDFVLYGLLVLIYLALLAAFLLNLPRLRKSSPPLADRK